jgi:hypothetical protein
MGNPECRNGNATALAGLPSWLRPFRHVTTPDFFDMR